MKDLTGINIQDLLGLIEENYNIVELRDCWDNEPVSIILLNKKHSIEEFQDAINEAKLNHKHEIEEYGEDWNYIEEDLDRFDYAYCSFDDARYWVEY